MVVEYRELTSQSLSQLDEVYEAESLDDEQDILQTWSRRLNLRATCSRS